MRPIIRSVRETLGLGSSARQGAAVFFMALTFVNVTNFVFHLVVSRIIGPAAYGALGALLGIVLVLGVPSSAIQVAITQEVAARRDAGDGEQVFIGRLMSSAVLAAIALGLVVVATGPLLRSFLHLPSMRSVVLLGAMFVPVVIGLVPRAVLLGELRFRPYAYGIIAGATVKMTAGVVLAKAGYGVNGAIGAIVLGDLASALWLLVPLRDLIVEATKDASLRIRGRDAIAAASVFTAYQLLLSIDTLLVRHVFSRVDSGFYAAASTAAQVVLFLPGAIGLIVFPRFAASGGRSVEARRALARALTVVAVLVTAAAALVAVEPRLVVTGFFGAEFRGSEVAVGVLGFAAAAMAIVNVLVYYLLAARSSLPQVLWVGVAAAAAAILGVGDTLERVGFIMLAVYGSLAVTLMVGVLRTRPRRISPITDESARRLWDLSEPTLDLTMVVPFYNPGPRFRPSLERLISVLEDEDVRFEIIAVSDGSTDRSEDAILDLRPDVVRCVRRERNIGKGSAIRTGLAMAEGRYLGFIDADGDIDPAVLRSFMTLIRLYDPDVILGSKRHPLSDVDYPALRRIYSWGYQQLTRLLFRLNVRDTQTGVKIARREVFAEALPLMVEKRFAFDLELFVVARHLGFKRFFEAPVSIGERFSSTISIRTVRGMLTDALGIFFRLRFLGFYDRPLEVAAGDETPAGSMVAGGRKASLSS